VSIVTPSLDQGQFLRRTVESVLGQSYPRVEYFVMDGGSTDESLEILRSYGDRFRWFSGPDAGQADSINKGFERCQGEVRAYLNADDVLRPNAVEVAVAHFRAHPECDLVYGCATFIDADDRMLGMYDTDEYSFERLARTCCICQPAAFWRARIARKVGPFDPGLHFAMDYDYWLRIARAGGRIHHIADVLADARVHPGAKSNRPERTAIYAEIFRALKTAGVPPSEDYASSLAAYAAELERQLEHARSSLTRARDDMAFLESDRAARLEVISDLARRLESSRARIEEIELDRQRRLDVIVRQGEMVDSLTAQVRSMEENSAARRADLARQTKEVEVLQLRLEEVEADRAARLRLIETQARGIDALRSQLDFAEADRAARLDIIQLQARQIEEDRAGRRADLARQAHEADVLRLRLEEVEADRAARLRLLETQAQGIDALKSQFDFVEADRAARLAVIEDQGRRIAALDAERERLLGVIADRDAALERSRATPFQRMLALARGLLRGFRAIRWRRPRLHSDETT